MELALTFYIDLDYIDLTLLQINNGADVFLEDISNQTALILAAMDEQPEIIKLLVNTGKNIDLLS